MNIFALHTSPVLAANLMCDQHVVKMVTETAQILCWAVQLVDAGWTGHAPSLEARDDLFSKVNKGLVPYSPSRAHMFHPCVLWAASNTNNFAWLVGHGAALSGEFEYRYGKRHAAEDVIFQAALAHGNLGSQADCTPWAMAFGEFECEVDHALPVKHRVVQAYRRYYEWKRWAWALNHRPMRWSKARVDPMPGMWPELV